MLKNVYIPIFCLMILSISTFAGVAGGLDRSFDTDGKLSMNIAGTTSARDIAVAPDKKILVAGMTGTDFFVARLRPDGSYDPTFDGDGKVTTSFTSGNDDAVAIKLLPDGKILVAGNTFNPTTGQDFAIARYNSDGSLDVSFDGDGKLTTDLGSNAADAAMTILLQNDGKYVVVGRTVLNGNDFAAVRYNTDGSLDTTFDGDGMVIISPSTASDQMWAAGIQENGRIVISGTTTSTTNTDFIVVRLTTNGALDPNWDGDGIVTTDISDSSDNGFALTIQPDGRVVVCGSASTTATGTDFACVRYLANGALNLNGFGTGGKVVTSFGGISNEHANAVEIDAEGRIVAIGQTNQFGTNDFAVVRYTPAGVPDNSFDGDGHVVTDFQSGSDFTQEGVLQADGKLLAVGTAFVGSSGGGIVRYHMRTSNVPFDFDGDDRTDVGIFRAAPGEWWYSRSSDNVVSAGQFGSSTDKITPGDFTGDGKSDIAFFRPATGFWYVLRSDDSSFFSFPFGSNGDIPVPADYDGDGKIDPAVFRPSNATWFISRSSDGGTTITGFGTIGDVPVVADFDGDRKADIGIFRPSAGEWWYSRSSDGQVPALQFGTSTDKPVPADFTGDGKADIAFFRPSDGFWYVLRSEDSSFFSFPFGATGDVPVVGDYDGDGIFDSAVFRPSNNTWYLNRSTAGVSFVGFGSSGDLPIPAAFLP